ncbi:MAG: hypothetical protein HKO59_02340 [Phycisphaerales bacterium]|nr:hypothetical protein [Phycisphaerae bacterium]NNF42001.1 hypothetical protein [Phycisphaerales bacterium]NNM24821.1 hypothetical protein [Phycisphaerales bacterium]
MMRTVMTILAGVMLAVVIGGCDSGTPEDAEMTQRREPPAEKRRPPGALGDADLSAEQGEGEPPPAGGEGGGGG